MRRTERLFAITEYLRGRRTGVTAEALAERFGVTVRTMYRDLDALRGAALPLQSERGRGGGYALDRAYALPPVNFTAREVAVLLAVGRFVAQTRVVPFVDTLAGALDKARGALPAKTQREMAALLETLTFVGVPAHAVPAAVRRAVEQAWFERRPLQIAYRGGDGALSQREVRIETVVMERGETLLNCTDLAKNEARQFKLHRVERAAVIVANPL